MLYALILTLIINQGVSVTTVTGFESRELCIQAGNAWLVENKRELKAKRWLADDTPMTAICAKQAPAGEE